METDFPIKKVTRNLHSAQQYRIIAAGSAEFRIISSPEPESRKDFPDSLLHDCGKCLKKAFFFLKRSHFRACNDDASCYVYRQFLITRRERRRDHGKRQERTIQTCEAATVAFHHHLCNPPCFHWSNYRLILHTNGRRGKEQSSSFIFSLK